MKKYCVGSGHLINLPNSIAILWYKNLIFLVTHLTKKGLYSVFVVCVCVFVNPFQTRLYIILIHFQKPNIFTVGKNFP